MADEPAGAPTDGTPATPPPSAAAATPDPASLAGGADPAANPEGGKPADGAPQPAVFDAAKLNLPDGLTAGDGLDKFSGLAKELGLNQDQAQKLLELYGSEAKGQQAKAAEAAQAWTDQQNKWQGEIKSEYSGAKLGEAQTRISRMIDNFGDGEVRKVLNLTGAGNSPALFRMLDKAAAALSEGSHVGGRPAGQQKDLAQKMYPNMSGAN